MMCSVVLSTFASTFFIASGLSNFCVWLGPDSATLMNPFRVAILSPASAGMFTRAVTSFNHLARWPLLF